MKIYAEDKKGWYDCEEDETRYPPRFKSKILKEVEDGEAELVEFDQEEADKQDAINKAKSDHIGRIYAPIEVDGNTFDADETSQTIIKDAVLNFDAAVQVAQDEGFGDGSTLPWTLANNSIVELAKDDLQKVVDALVYRFGQSHYQYQKDKQAIL